MQHQLIEAIEDTQWGLRLPNGNVVWPPNQYMGYDLATPEQRNAVPALLEQMASQIGQDPTVFTANYGWVSRTTTTYVVSREPGETRDITAQWVVDVEAAPPDPNE